LSHYAFTEFLKSARRYSERPALFEPGNAPFWDDPYISTQLLKFHLDPSVEAASRAPARIDAQAENLVSSGVLNPGDRLLDLGCGPGLYSLRLARNGLNVTGVDISSHSQNYAIEEARKSALAIDYRQMDFLHLDYESEFDAVLQSYGELNTFSDDVLAELLSHIRASLKPHGLLLFDVTTRAHRKRTAASNRWYVTEGGLWKPGLHLVLEEGFDYPDRPSTVSGSTTMILMRSKKSSKRTGFPWMLSGMTLMVRPFRRAAISWLWLPVMFNCAITLLRIY